MKKFKVELKNRKFDRLIFIFKEWNEACDFCGNAIIDGEDDVSATLTIIKDEEENDERNI
jgi:hypothetical protein